MPLAMSSAGPVRLCGAAPDSSTRGSVRVVRGHSAVPYTLLVARPGTGSALVPAQLKGSESALEDRASRRQLRRRSVENSQI